MSEVVDYLSIQAQKRKSNLHAVNVKTRFYTILPAFTVFMALLKFMEPYIAVAFQCVSDPNNSLKCRKEYQGTPSIDESEWS